MTNQASPSGNPHEPIRLTPTEANVLALLPTYRTLAGIGVELGIGRTTVKTHVQHIYKKLGATNRADAAHLAEQAGLLPEPEGAIRTASVIRTRFLHD
jgi:DNA-binding CsgD family transcriptional regulator